MELTEIVLSIKEKVCKELIDYLIAHEYEINSDASYQTTMLCFKDYKEKRLPIINYKVTYSSVLNSHLLELDDDKRGLVELFKNNLENGLDMNSHLSKFIFKTNDDKLLNYWGIKHLHLNEATADCKSDFHSNRSDTYLLICQQQNEILFLDVTHHLNGDEFANVDFLKILEEENWLEKVGIIEAKDAIPDSVPEISSPADIMRLWKCHVLSIFKLNGKVYVPIRGESCAGNSLSSTRYLIENNRSIDREAEKLKDKSINSINVCVIDNGAGGVPEFTINVDYD